MRDCFDSRDWPKPSLRSRIKWRLRMLWWKFFPPKFVLPIVRSSFPMLKAEDIVSVQPMTTGKEYFLERYSPDDARRELHGEPLPVDTVAMNHNERGRR